jgi:hypothetical protein
MFNADNLIATCEAPFIMFALPPKADMCGAQAHFHSCFAFRKIDFRAPLTVL